MTKHTPGPWHYGFRDETDKPGFAVDVYGPDGQPIAGMERTAGNGTYGAERDSNARLIAAAPELLEALEVLKGFAEARDGETYVREHLKIARVAIAKTRGQEQE